MPKLLIYFSIDERQRAVRPGVPENAKCRRAGTNTRLPKTSPAATITAAITEQQDHDVDNQYQFHRKLLRLHGLAGSPEKGD
jgi:hypothetical protein